MCTDSGTTNLQLESSVGDVAKADQICEAEEVTRLEKCSTEDAAKPDGLEKCPTDVINTNGTCEAEKEVNQLEKCPANAACSADAAKPDGLEKCPADVINTDGTCEAEKEDTKLEKPSPPTGLVAMQPTVTGLSESTPILNPCDQSDTCSHVESASHKLPTVESKAEEDASHNKESESNNEISTNVISCDQLDEHMESDQQPSVESKAEEQDADKLPSDAKSEVSEKEDSESSEEDVLLDYPAVPQDMSKLVLSTEFSHEDLLDPDHEGAEEDSLTPCQNLLKQQSDMDTQVPVDLHSDHGTSNPCVEHVGSSSLSACNRQGDNQSAELDRTLPNEKPPLENNNVETFDCEGEAVELMDEGDSDSVGHDLPTSDLHSSRSKLGELLRNLPVPTSESQEDDEGLEKSDIQSELEKCSSNQDVPKVFMCGEFLSLDGEGEMKVGYHPSSQEESASTKGKSQKQKQKQKQRKLPRATPKKSPTRKPTPKKASKEGVPGPGGVLSSSEAAHTETVVPPDLDYEASKVPLKPRKSLHKKKKKVKKPSLESDFPVAVTEVLPEADHGELTAPKPEIASSQASENWSSVWQTSSNTSEAIHLSEASIRKKRKRTKRKGHTIEDSSMISKPKKRKKAHVEKEMVPSLSDLLVDTSKVTVIDLSKHGEPCSRESMKTTEKGGGSRKRKGWRIPSEVCAICHVQPHLYIWV